MPQNKFLNFKIDELLTIHKSLNDHRLGQETSAPGKSFWTYLTADFRFVTQNMEKTSRNTAWVQEAPHRAITWIFPRVGGGYLGQIRSYVTGGRHPKEIIEVSDLQQATQITRIEHDIGN